MRGTLKEVLEHFKAVEPLGEIVIVLAGHEDASCEEDGKNQVPDPMQMLIGTGKRKNKYK